MRFKAFQPLKPLQKGFLRSRKKLGKMSENVGKELEVCWGNTYFFIELFKGKRNFSIKSYIFYCLFRFITYICT